MIAAGYRPARRQNARIRAVLSPGPTNGKSMQSVIGTAFSRPSLAARGLRKARNATLAAVMLVASLGATSGAWGAEGQSAPATPAAAIPPITAVRVTTSMGAFVIELNAERAPLTVQNFLRY